MNNTEQYRILGETNIPNLIGIWLVAGDDILLIALGAQL